MATKKKITKKTSKPVEITPPYAGETGKQSEVPVTQLHQHPDANNFGASHDESEARKAQKRADNGYTGL